VQTKKLSDLAKKFDARIKAATTPHECVEITREFEKEYSAANDGENAEKVELGPLDDAALSAYEARFAAAKTREETLAVERAFSRHLAAANPVL
jgi:hypothetical protein